MDDTALLNRWQRGFPLCRAPFAVIADAAGMDEAAVIDRFARLRADGRMSRIGGLFGAGAGGDGLLAAYAVPAERLGEVAARVSAHPAVNHNYAREHAFNLWFVVHGPDAAAVDAVVDALDAAVGARALRLRMQRAYRIDLGFDLRQATAAGASAAALRVQPVAPPVADADRALAALVEDGLPLLARPFDAWAQALRRSPQQVLATLSGWLDAGTLRRFGAVVRHHEFGFAANAMTVFNVPDAAVDACGEALAREAAVTLAYRRSRASAAGWPYNLYCMVHGRSRAAVEDALAALIPRCGLDQVDRAVLFSSHRYKQTGPRRFAPWAADLPAALAQPALSHAPG